MKGEKGKKPKKRALPHVFVVWFIFAVLTEARMVIAPSWSSDPTTAAQRMPCAPECCPSSSRDVV